MKKMLSCLLLCVMLFSMAGCSSSNGNTSNSDSSSAEQSNLPPEGKGKMGGGLGHDSVDTSDIQTQYTDVAYGTVSSTQTLNIYLPNEGEGPFPVIVAIHGGAFMMGNATGGDVAAMLEGVKHGYAVASINYRLSGEAPFPAAVNDCKAAIRFIKANADKYNLDAGKIAVWGDSAGGNLAAMIGTTGNVDTLNGDNQENLKYSSAVQAVIDWFGPLDFLKMDEQFKASGITPKMGATSTENSPESKYIGKLITQAPALTQKANPETYIDTLTKQTAPSFLIEHGTADANVPTQQSVDFAAELKSAIGKDKVTLELLDGAGHGTSEFNEQENLDKVFAFLDEVLK